jgi:hypothetical protein
MENPRAFVEIGNMSEQPTAPTPIAPVEEIQREWLALASRVGQLEAQRAAFEQENKTLRRLLETVIEHRQKSHAELVILLTTLVSKLPINEVGVLVSRLVEHNTNVSQFLAALAKGATDVDLPQPTVLKTLDHTKRDLVAAVKPLVEELIQLDAPVEAELLRALPAQPELFFTPRMVRASRCFLKGQVPRERIVREFGEAALGFFNDMTTDPKLNPRPKREEILLAFKSDFEALLQQNPTALPDQRQDLLALFQKVQRSKAANEPARAQRNAFHRLSFLIDLLHYYENQSTEPADAVFAQRLPSLVEQLALAGPQDKLDEKLIAQAEELLAHVIGTDHRLMIINNVGKGGGMAKLLKFVLRLRAPKVSDGDRDTVVVEFVRHLLPTTKPPPVEAVTCHLQLLGEEAQRLVVRALMTCDRVRREEAEALGQAAAAALGLKDLAEAVRQAAPTLPPEVERKQAWDKIKELITRRRDPAAIAAAIRDRLHARYDADELRQSWLTLIEADAISLIRIFCQVPYCADGRTDPIAQTILETYVTRLTHEKYAAIYHKVVTSLRNMFHTKPDSPTLLNFMSLARWASPEAAHKLCADVGMPLPIH